MRRREYLHAAVGAAGLAGLSSTALTAAGSDDGSSSPTERTTTTATATTTTATTATTTTASTSTATEAPTSTSTDAAPDDGNSLEPLGQVEVSNDGGSYQATEAVTTADGRYAFVSKLDGFHVVDCADPASPEIVATRERFFADDGGPLEDLMDLAYNRGRLAVVNNSESFADEFVLFDVRDPTDPRFVGSFAAGYGIHNCDLHGNHAYLTTGTDLEIVDVSTPEPDVVSRWSVVDHEPAFEDVHWALRNLHDVYLQDGYAYLAYWDAGTWVVDVTDPEDPTYVTHVADYTAGELASLSREEVQEYFYEPDGNDHYVQPNDDGTLLAVGGESWDVEAEFLESEEPDDEDVGGPTGITLWDIADPENPAELSVIDPPQPPEGETARMQDGYTTTSHNFDFVGDYLYSSWYRAGVKVHDVSDPEAPEELARWENGEETSFWTARVAVPGEFFIGSSYENPADEGAPGGLYTFPDPADSDATLTPAGPDIEVPTSTSTRTPTEADGTTAKTVDEGGTNSTTTSGVVNTESLTATPTATRPEAPTATAIDDEGTATSGDGPGFGPLATLSALGVGAWRYVHDEE